MLGAKRAISSATIHRVRMHLAPQLGASLGDQPWKPWNALHFGRFWRQFRWVDDLGAAHAPLNDLQVGAADASDEKRGGHWQVCATILDEVIKLARLVADAVEKLEIVSRVIAVKVFVAAVKFRQAAIEEQGESFVPIEVRHKVGGIEMASKLGWRDFLASRQRNA